MRERGCRGVKWRDWPKTRTDRPIVSSGPSRNTGGARKCTPRTRDQAAFFTFSTASETRVDRLERFVGELEERFAVLRAGGDDRVELLCAAARSGFSKNSVGDLADASSLMSADIVSNEALPSLT
jgi:hypothetical protein